MALHFTNKKKGPLPFILACLALALAITCMILWIWIGFRKPTEPNSDNSATDSSRYEEPNTTIGRSLVILDYADSKQFMLIQSDPVRNRITVATLPANLADSDGNTLTTLFTKHGPLRVTQAVSSALELSVNHYITLTADGTQDFLDDLDSGVLFTLPEDIRYIDDNGSQIRLTAGEHTLSGAQTAAVLQYTDWKDTDSIAADIIAALINQYLVSGRRFDGYFASLANAAQTDLRIDNFNAFRATLAQLAESNQGTLCQTITLDGTTENGIFVPNLQEMKKSSELYQ